MAKKSFREKNFGGDKFDRSQLNKTAEKSVRLAEPKPVKPQEPMKPTEMQKPSEPAEMTKPPEILTPTETMETITPTETIEPQKPTEPVNIEKPKKRDWNEGSYREPKHYKIETVNGIPQQVMSEQEIKDINYKHLQRDSIIRGELMQKNADKMAEIKKNFRYLFVISFLLTGVLWLGVSIYFVAYIIVFLSKNSMDFLTFVFDSATGGEKIEGETAFPVMQQYPFLWLTYLFGMAFLVVFAIAFKRKELNNILLWIYAFTSVFGFISIMFGLNSVMFSVYLILYGIFGVFLASKTLNQFDDLEWLSREEGYPDFIVAVNETRTMVNTNGLFAAQADEIRKERVQRAQVNKKKTNDLGMKVVTLNPAEMLAEPQNNGVMDDLSVDFAKPLDEYLAEEGSVMPKERVKIHDVDQLFG